ncbi:MAG: DUF1850 domain-containing protein, partial [Pseudomonas stutzeri]|nr:DUF1850 domain-containing protein [Stutzerimonas stutzeri]
LCFDQRCHAMSEWLGPPQADQPALEVWGCTVQTASVGND